MESCLYEGYLQHRRLSPAEHVFRYTLYLVYLDLDELPAVLGGEAYAPLAFQEKPDSLSAPGTPDGARTFIPMASGAAQFLLPAVRVNVVPLNLISGSCGAENEPPRKLKIRQTEQIVHGMIPFLKIVPDNVALSAVILKNNAAKHPAINIKSMQKL